MDTSVAWYICVLKSESHLMASISHSVSYRETFLNGIDASIAIKTTN